MAVFWLTFIALCLQVVFILSMLTYNPVIAYVTDENYVGRALQDQEAHLSADKRSAKSDIIDLLDPQASQRSLKRQVVYDFPGEEVEIDHDGSTDVSVLDVLPSSENSVPSTSLWRFNDDDFNLDILETEEGRRWLRGQGQGWLQSRQGDRWLKSKAGKSWLRTADGRKKKEID